RLVCGVRGRCGGADEWALLGRGARLAGGLAGVAGLAGVRAGPPGARSLGRRLGDDQPAAHLRLPDDTDSDPRARQRGQRIWQALWRDGREQPAGGLWIAEQRAVDVG